MVLSTGFSAHICRYTRDSHEHWAFYLTTIFSVIPAIWPDISYFELHTFMPNIVVKKL